MHDLFIIATTHSSLLYILFYSAAFLLTAGIFIYQGFKNHYPGRTWLVITLFGVMCCVIGCKVIMIDPSIWKQFWHGQPLPGTGRSVLGGMIGLILGLLIAQRWLRFNRPVLDHLAYALPFGMAINRVGCLFAGCCFGTPTHLPWGIQYGATSHAFHTQVTHFQIPASSTLSLPVHPTQMYDIIICLFVLFLVWITRKYWRAPESRFLFAVLCYASFRFIEEFFRQASTGPLGEIYLGFKLVQWLILGAVVIMAFVLVRRERKPGNLFSDKNIQPVSLNREFLLFATVPVLLMLTSGWLDPFEKYIIWIFMIPLVLVFFQKFYSHWTVRSFRWKAPLVLLIALVTMSQDTVYQSTPSPKTDYKGWWSLSAFGSLGQYEERYYDCDGNITNRFDRSYSTWGAGADYHYKPLEDHHLTAGINVYSATDHTDETDELDYDSPAMNAFISYDMRYAGASLGMNVFFNSYRINDITPMFSLWGGKKDVLFGEVGVMTDYYQMGEPGLFSFGLGSGLGKVDRSIIRADLCMEWDDDWFGESNNSYISGLNLAGNAWINDRVTLKVSVFLGKTFGGSLGLHMHMGKDRWQARR